MASQIMRIVGGWEENKSKIATLTFGFIQNIKTVSFGFQSSFSVVNSSPCLLAVEDDWLVEGPAESEP